MSYRPLNHNERIIVKRTLYEERGLNEAIASSLFMAYEGVAKAKDIPEFDVYQESERERLATPPLPINSNEDKDEPVLLAELDQLFSNNKEKPLPLSVWLFGDESLVGQRHRQLRLKFHNSRRYRELLLSTFEGKHLITDIDDLEHIQGVLEKFDRQYPSTRQGLISLYEIYFGDPSGFCYSLARQREDFLNKPETRQRFLKDRNLPEDFSLEDIKVYLLKLAPQ